MSPTFRSLGVRNYRLYAAGQVVSNTGTWLQRVAQDWLVLRLTGSGTDLGIVTALQFLPMIASPWGGVIVDRRNTRRLLMITQSIMGVLAAVLGVLDLAGAVRVWHVYLLALLLGTVTAVDNPGRQAFVSELVGPDELPNAVSLNSANFNLARIVGPAVAGLLISVVGTGWVFELNALSFVAVLAGLRAIRVRELYPTPRAPRRPGQLRDGFAYIAARPDLMVLLFVVFFVGTFGMNFQLTLALMSQHVFHQGSSGFGLLSSLMAVGSLSGSLYAAHRRVPRMRVVLVSAAVFGVLEVAVGLMPGYLTFALLLIPCGAAVLTFTSTANAATQSGVEPLMRGRVMGVYMLVFLGGTPLGSPLMGWVGQAFGPRWALILGGVLSGFAALVGAYALVRHGRRRGRPAVSAASAEAVPALARASG